MPPHTVGPVPAIPKRRAGAPTLGPVPEPDPQNAPGPGFPGGAVGFADEPSGEVVGDAGNRVCPAPVVGSEGEGGMVKGLGGQRRQKVSHGCAH